MRILMIEDEKPMTATVEIIARSQSFFIHTTDTGEEGIELAKLYDHDVILLDLGLPDMNGLDVLKSLRRAKIDTPVIILSGETAVDLKIKTLAAGADDYIVKPFNKEEFIARLKAVVRRSKGFAQSVITTGKLNINLDAKSVDVAGTPVHLTIKEYQILELLSLRKGTALTKEVFLNHLYGGLDEPTFKVLDVFMCKLRKKLAAVSGDEEYIHTVWGFGHVLRDPIELRAAA